MTSVGIIFSAAQLKRLCDGLSEKVGVRFNNSQLRRLVRMPLSLRGLSSDTVELGFESYFNLHFSYNSNWSATIPTLFSCEIVTCLHVKSLRHLDGRRRGLNSFVCGATLPRERHKVSRWGAGIARSRYLDKAIFVTSLPLGLADKTSMCTLRHFVAAPPSKHPFTSQNRRREHLNRLSNIKTRKTSKQIRSFD